MLLYPDVEKIVLGDDDVKYAGKVAAICSVPYSSTAVRPLLIHRESLHWIWLHNCHRMCPVGSGIPTKEEK